MKIGTKLMYCCKFVNLALYIDYWAFDDQYEVFYLDVKFKLASKY